MDNDVISFSEAAALAACEEKWSRIYQWNQEHERTPAMSLGTLLDVASDNWLAGNGMWIPERWLDGYHGESLYLEQFDEELVDRANWLCARYEEHYGEKPPKSWKIEGVQEVITFEYRGVTIRHKLDGVIRAPLPGERKQRLWLREVKSYGKRDRVKLVPADPQLTWYSLAMLKQYGELPFGILFDGIYTYQWKRDKHPPADSFDRVWSDRSPEQIALHMRVLDSVLDRREQLRGDVLPIPNVGWTCNGCGFKNACHARLATGEDEFYDGEIEVEDDGDEDWA